MGKSLQISKSHFPYLYYKGFELDDPLGLFAIKFYDSIKIKWGKNFKKVKWRGDGDRCVYVCLCVFSIRPFHLSFLCSWLLQITTQDEQTGFPSTVHLLKSYSFLQIAYKILCSLFLKNIQTAADHRAKLSKPAA